MLILREKISKKEIHCTMSESDQPNGTANGDVPEIELIIKVGMDFFAKINNKSFLARHSVPFMALNFIHSIFIGFAPRIFPQFILCAQNAYGSPMEHYYFFLLSSVCVRLFVRTQPIVRKMQTQYPYGCTFAVLLRVNTYRIGTLNGLRTHHTLAKICKMFILLDCCLRLSYRETCNYFSASRGIRFLCVVD